MSFFSSLSSFAPMLTMGAQALGTVANVQAALMESKQQAALASYQADIARQNQELAENQASAQRKQAYADKLAKQRETAILIGKQRAIAGASGAAVDVGSNLDVQVDTAARGEIDAVGLYNQGMDRAYQAELEAWNYGNQAAAYDAQASAAKSGSWLNAASAALGGIAQIGSTWGKWAGTNSPNTGNNKYWDRALNDWSSTRPRH